MDSGDRHAITPLGIARRVLFVVLAMLMLTASGCGVDSWMDPSVVGRWEGTPVVLPILDRIDVIDEPEESIPGLSQITSEDLVPHVTEYTLGPGDLITITIFELVTPNVETVYTRRVDELGFVRMPFVGQVKAGGLTTKELEQEIINILHPEVLRDPKITVITQDQRQNTYSVIGAAGAVGTYALLKNDFRLLDAIAQARGIPSDMEKIYVIRQVPLTELASGQTFGGNRAEPGTHRPPLEPRDDDQSAGGGDNGEIDAGSLLEQLSEGLEGNGGGAAAPEPEAEPAPADHGNNDGDSPAGLGDALEGDRQRGDERWVNVNGKWVRVQNAAPDTGGVDSGVDDGSSLPSPEEMVTQRIIEIDAQELLKGVARYNIVVRADDVIRVPIEARGNVYIGGEISRPGTYSLPGERSLTLKQLVISAGGLSPLAIPERVDLIRRIGTDSEATVQLNLRAIFEGVQPDIYLKPDDTINIGTNLPAPWLAIFRNSFRFTYGMGFLLDRNFGGEIIRL